MRGAHHRAVTAQGASQNHAAAFERHRGCFQNLYRQKRCAGLTQAGVSHLWQTYSPSGILPTKCSYDQRWARTGRLSTEKAPYPPDLKHAPVHSQQPSGSSLFCTCLKKRSIGDTVAVAISKAPSFVWLETAFGVSSTCAVLLNCPSIIARIYYSPTSSMLNISDMTHSLWASAFCCCSISTTPSNWR